MKQIRRGVFETNSSSVHTMVICSKEEFDDWKNGKLIYDEWNEKLIDKNSISASPFECLTYNKYYDRYSNDYCMYEEEYTTKNKDEVVVFGYYGSDC